MYLGSRVSCSNYPQVGAIFVGFFRQNQPSQRDQHPQRGDHQEVLIWDSEHTTRIAGMAACGAHSPKTNHVSTCNRRAPPVPGFQGLCSLFRAEAEYRPVPEILGAAVVGNPQATDGRVTSAVRPHGHAGAPSGLPWRRVPSSARMACRPQAHRSWLPRRHQCPPACCLQATPDPSQLRLRRRRRHGLGARREEVVDSPRLIVPVSASSPSASSSPSSSSGACPRCGEGGHSGQGGRGKGNCVALGWQGAHWGDVRIG